jgi:hypothetical protein
VNTLAHAVSCFTRDRIGWRCRRVVLFCFAALAVSAYSPVVLANSEREDKIADVLVWVIVVIVPIVAVALIWTLHVWPERVAEKRGHPQKDAIQALCFLSLVFGGLLWPFAMLWAYMRPPRVTLARSDAPVPNDELSTTPASPDEIDALRIQLDAIKRRLDELDGLRSPPPGDRA